MPDSTISGLGPYTGALANLLTSAVDTADTSQASTGTNKRLQGAVLQDLVKTYKGLQTITTAYTFDGTEPGKLLMVNSATDITLTLPANFTRLGQWADVLNIGTGTVTLAGGAYEINTAGTTSVVLFPGDILRVTYISSTAPRWSAPAAEGTAAVDGNMIIGQDPGGGDPVEWVSAAFPTVLYDQTIGLTNKTSPSTSNDYVLIQDTGTGAIARVAIGNLPSSGGSSTLGGLSDVTLAGLLDGQVIQYNSASSEFENVYQEGAISVHWAVDATDGALFGNGIWTIAYSLPVDIRITAVRWDCDGTAAGNVTLLADGVAVTGINGMAISGTSSAAASATVTAGSLLQLQISSAANAADVMLQFDIRRD